MSDVGSETELPALSLTPDERRLFTQLFKQADTERIGVVTGEQAVKFFEKTNLSPIVLGEIWQVADSENRGLLTKPGFYIALRLIGQVQAGREARADLALKPGPLPRFDGFKQQSSQLAPAPAAQSILQSQGTGSIRIPPLTADRIAQFTTLFERSGAQNGQLKGDTAKSVFERAGLPNDILGRIWALADRRQSGGLDVTEFIVAMHLITSFKSKTMTALPQSLPSGLYEAAARRPSMSRSPGAVPPTTHAAIPRQFSGSTQRTSSPLGRSSQYPAAPQQQSGTSTDSQWLVTAQEKAKYDGYFDSIDTAHLGYIMGDQAVRFFANSRLSEDALASIWDLADVKSEGKLDRDLFAVAMYLVRQQRSGGGPLPAFLPAALLPPSMRVAPQSQVAPAPASIFDPISAAPAMQKSASEDLFGMDGPPLSVQPLQAQNTANNDSTKSPDGDPFAGPSMPSSPSSPQQATTYSQTSTNTFKPFQPSSAFGATLTGQHTGGSMSSAGPSRAPQQPPQPPSRQPAKPTSALDDLLGGDDSSQTPSVPENATELANMSGQISNLRNQMQDAQTKRSTHESDLASSNTQKQELQTRLTQFRAQYEQQVRSVKDLEQQLTQSRESTRNLQREMAMLQGTHEDLESKHRESTQQLEADRRENAALKEKIGGLNTEISKLKPALEKLKSDARQTKGMIAINKKQMSTSEAERDNLQTSIDEHNRAAQAEQAQPMTKTSSSRGASPNPSGSNNPFFRQPSQQRPDSRQSSRSGQPTTHNPSAFDALFGPSFAQNASTQQGTSILQQQPAVSAPSTSSDGRPTPSASPPLSAFPESPATSDLAPPPPPSELRQFTPGMLPMRTPLSRGESVASSVRAMPPASRVDLSEPNFLVASRSESPLALRDEPSSENSERPGATTQQSASALTQETIPGAFPADSNSPEKRALGSEADGRAEDPERPVYGARTSSRGAQAMSSTDASRPTTAAETPAANVTSDHSDDSSSDDEGPGFDDNFSGVDKRAMSGSTSQSNAQTSTGTGRVLDDQIQPSPSELPPITAQASPPSYDKSMSPDNASDLPVRKTSNQFPPAFEGLLPSREVPEMSASPPIQTNPDLPQHQPVGTGKLRPNPPHTSISTVGEMQPFHDASSRPSSADGKRPQNGQSKSAFDDDFANFDDLAEARVVDDKSFDFGDNQSETEFNPHFDSPAASMSTMGHAASSQQQTPAARSSQPPLQGQDGTALGRFQFFGSGSQSGGGAIQSAASTHDWDAIFSNIDQPGPSTGMTAGGFNTKGRNASAGSFPTPQASPPPANVGRSGSNTQPQSQGGRVSAEAPQASDDPFLSKLTSMGYPRDKALAALEKYDYDLNKAADHLSSPN